MTRKISKAIDFINSEIERSGTIDFLSQFDDECNTYCFVKNCLTDNKLDKAKVSEYSKEQQQDYLYNILHYWMGAKTEIASKMVEEYNR